MIDQKTSQPPPAPEGDLTKRAEQLQKLARTFAMEFLTGHHRPLREDEQPRFDQLFVVMLAFAAQAERDLLTLLSSQAQEIEGLTEKLAEFVHEHQAQVAMLNKEIEEVRQERAIVCRCCGKKSATCFGVYEQMEQPITAACDDCCGHGNEGQVTLDDKALKNAACKACDAREIEAFKAGWQAQIDDPAGEHGDVCAALCRRYPLRRELFPAVDAVDPHV